MLRWTLLFCVFLAPVLSRTHRLPEENQSSLHKYTNNGQVRSKRQSQDSTADLGSPSVDMNSNERQNEPSQNNKDPEISMYYSFYGSTPQYYKPPPPPPPPPPHWGWGGYYGQYDYRPPPPPPPPHDGRYPRRPDYFGRHHPPPPPPPDYSYDRRPPPPPPHDDRPWSHPPHDRGPPPPYEHGPPGHRPPPYGHGPPPPPPHHHGPPHHPPPPPYGHGPPHYDRRPPPPPPHERGPPYHERGRPPPPPNDQGPPYRDNGPTSPTQDQTPLIDVRRRPQQSPNQNESPPSNDQFNDKQSSNTNDQDNTELLKNLKLVFSDDFRKSFLQNRQTFQSDSSSDNQGAMKEPKNGIGQGEPLINVDADINHSINITPPPLPHIFQVIPVTPEN